MTTHVIERGQRLGQALGTLRTQRPFVLGIPRGGVLIADIVARALRAPFDVLVAGKVFAPGGAAFAGVAAGGGLVFDDEVLARFHLTGEQIERKIEEERERQNRLLERMRGAWPAPPLDGRTVILVDDAIVTGLTMRAAIASVLARGAERVVVATSLCSTDASAVVAAGMHEIVHLESLPPAVARRAHEDERQRLCPPIGDAEIHELITRELREVGEDPFGSLTIDGV